MSRFVNFVNLDTGETQRLFNDLSEDVSTDYHAQSPIVMGSTHYIDNEQLKLVVCKKATQAKKAWASLGLAEHGRPQTPWAVWHTHDEKTRILAMQLTKYIVFLHKNNA